MCRTWICRCIKNMLVMIVFHVRCAVMNVACYAKNKIPNHAQVLNHLRETVIPRKKIELVSKNIYKSDPDRVNQVTIS